MALINCSECGAEISDKATVCPHCGAPVGNDKESKGSGVKQLTTTQGTSKALKMQSLLSGIAIIVGLFWAMGSGNDPGAGPGLLLFGGLTWFIVTRFRIWWHHS